MRPLIEILEDERTLVHKLESVHRFLLRDDDAEILGILYVQKDKIEHQLKAVRTELKDYIAELFNQS
jgi:hypothetical protein